MMQQLNQTITVCEHPLIHHHFSIIRDQHCNHEMFRIGLRRIAQHVLHEATRHLPLHTCNIQTPLSDFAAKKLTPDIPIILLPILRAGLSMSEVAMDMIPSARTYHIGLYRDEKTFQPVTYYNKLPNTINYKSAQVIILDPMLATGGSIMSTIEMITQLGVKDENITVACIIASPEGVKVINDAHPKIRIVCGAIDECLNEQAYIVPGLGDAGDRTYGTV